MGDHQEDEIDYLELVLVRRDGTAVNRRFGRELGEEHDGSYTEAPSSVHISNDNRLNQINIEDGYEPSPRTSRKVIDFLLKWGWVPIVCVLGTILLLAYLGYQNRDENPITLPSWNSTSANNLKVTVESSMCNYNYSCPALCSTAVNQHTGCCKGCYMSQSMGQCGLTVNVQYWNVSKSGPVPKIFLLVTADGIEFWQTGFALPVTGQDLFDVEDPHAVPISSIVYTNGSGVIQDGCFGTQSSVAIIGCLSTRNLTASKYTGFPTKSCEYYQGTCIRLNNVWTTDIPGCVGNLWVGNNITIDLPQLAPASYVAPSLAMLATGWVLASLF